MSAVAKERSRWAWLLVSFLAGLAVVGWGTYRGYPSFKDPHAVATIGRELGCDQDPQGGDSCNYVVTFRDGDQQVHAVLRGANPGEIDTQSGLRTVTVYYAQTDPADPHEVADDEINNVLVVLAGLAIIGGTAFGVRKAARERAGTRPQ
jgi:hypothetical protein